MTIGKSIFSKHFLLAGRYTVSTRGAGSLKRDYRWKHHHARPQNGLSYISVSGEKPLLGLTMGQLFDQTVEKFGDTEGLVVRHQNIRRTYAQLKEETDNLAEGLLSLGLQKGDRVGLWGTNSHEWYLTHYAVAKAGLVLVSVNPAYQGRELLYAINRVNLKALVMADKHGHQDYYEILSSVVPSFQKSEPGKIQDKAAPSLTTVISMTPERLKGTFSFPEIVDAGRKSRSKDLLNKMSKLIQFDDTFNLQFTSGTTGQPKGVMLSHHNMVNNSYLVTRRFSYSHEDKICLPVPLFHCYGQVVGMLAGLHSGATNVFPACGYDPKAAMQVTAEEKCTALYGTPTMHVDMTNVPDIEKLDLSALKVAVSAGATAPEELVRDMRKRYSCKVVIVYGLTETSPAIFQTLPDDSDDLGSSTVGYPLEHTEIKIVDSEGKTVPLGTEGEMCARGYMIMSGYWEEPKKTAEVINSAKWFYTGDSFVMLESGHARIMGRFKDMIIRGGENIYPREIEEFLHLHPKIVEAHVFGVPDHRLGEEVAVWVRLKDGEQMTDEDLRQYCKGQIAHYKIPRHIQFRNEFPKTTSGKIQKFKMREVMVKELGLKA